MSIFAPSAFANWSICSGVFDFGSSPPSIVRWRYSGDATAKAVSSAEYRQRTIDGGLEPKSNTPEQMLQVAKVDAAKIDKIVRTAGIKAE